MDVFSHSILDFSFNNFTFYSSSPDSNEARGGVRAVGEEQASSDVLHPNDVGVAAALLLAQGTQRCDHDVAGGDHGRHRGRNHRGQGEVRGGPAQNRGQSHQSEQGEKQKINDLNIQS